MGETDTQQPEFPSGASGLYSTASDWYRFGRLLLADGEELLSKESVRLMTTDHLSHEQREASAVFLEERAGVSADPGV